MASLRLEIVADQAELTLERIAVVKAPHHRHLSRVSYCHNCK